MDEVRGRLQVAVPHKWIEVRPVGPHDGPEVVVYATLCKIVGFGEWLEHRAMQVSCEIDITRAAIAEADPQPIVTEHLRGRDPYEVHRLILRQRVGRLRGAATPFAAPAPFQVAPGAV